MSTRFKTPSAVMLMVFRNNFTEVLLQKRQNTGYMDGYWDFSATGHVEKNEPMKEACIREAREEIGIDINPVDLHFATIAHKLSHPSGLIYYNGYFYCEKYNNTPQILEPQKVSELVWFKVNNLPKLLIEDRVIALNQFFKNNPYHEVGW